MTTPSHSNRLTSEIDPEGYLAAEFDSRRHLVRTLVTRRRRVMRVSTAIAVGAIVVMAVAAVVLLR